MCLIGIVSVYTILLQNAAVLKSKKKIKNYSELGVEYLGDQGKKYIDCNILVS